MSIRSRANVIVVLFFHRYRWGIQIRGDERGFLEKAKAFKRLGINLRVLEKNPSFQEDAREEVYTSIKVKGCRIPPKNAFQLFVLALCAIEKAFRNVPRHPLAIYSYNQDVENVFPGLLLRLLTGAPLVVIHHQIDATSVLPFGQSIALRRKEGYGLISAMWRSIPPALNRFGLLNADRHIALSKAAKEDAEKALGIDQCIVIGNGVDTVKFRPLNLSRVYDAAFFGRLAPQKGIDILLRAWSNIVQTNPNARLILIGGADEANFKKYRQMISELRLVNNVTIAGFQSDEKVVELLNSSKVFVFPSRKEGFAQSVSQAMACGMCCILSDIPALREYYGKSAILVQPENVDALSSAISLLLADERRQKELRAQAREQVIGLSWSTTARLELIEITRPKTK